MFHMLNSYMWLLVTRQDGVEIGHFNHCRKFYFSVNSLINILNIDHLLKSHLKYTELNTNMNFTCFFLPFSLWVIETCQLPMRLIFLLDSTAADGYRNTLPFILVFDVTTI